MRRRTKPRTIAYLRVSTDEQDLSSQRLSCLDFARKEGLKIDEFIDCSSSSARTLTQRKIEFLFGRLQAEDTLLLPELSRLGRSVTELLGLIDRLISAKVRVVAIKEGLRIGNGENNIQATVMLTIFSLLAQVERELIRERTRAGLQAARAKGKVLGRPEGSRSEVPLDGKRTEIEHLLSLGVPKVRIASTLKVPLSNLKYYLKTRGIQAGK